MHISIDLSEPHAQALRDRAARLGLAPEQLARVAIADLLDRTDAAFDAALAQVLRKNADLYKRLA